MSIAIIKYTLGDRDLYFSGKIAEKYFRFKFPNLSLSQYSQVEFPEKASSTRNKSNAKGWAQEGTASFMAQEFCINNRSSKFGGSILFFSGFTFVERGFATGIARTVKPNGIYIKSLDNECDDWLGLNVVKHTSIDLRSLRSLQINNLTQNIEASDFKDVRLS